MTKKQYANAAAAYAERKRREEAGKALERRTLSDYPASHNPYILHDRQADCYAGCKLSEGSELARAIVDSLFPRF